jgi:hypothetical protein
MGWCAACSVSTGLNATVFGSEAGCTLSTGINNTLIGQRAGCAITTGASNTAVGQAAGKEGIGGTNNVLMGDNSGRCMTGGNFNSVLGSQAFNGATGSTPNNLGQFNTALGYQAMGIFTGGNNNIAIGYASGYTFCNLAGLNNQIVMGNASHTNAFIQVAWTVVSDERKKKIKGPVALGLDFVKNLEPIEYQFIDEETQEIKDETYRYGFSAQKVRAQEVDPEHPVIVGGSDEKGWNLTTDYMLPPLVNAIQELSAQVEELKAKLAALEGKN